MYTWNKHYIRYGTLHVCVLEHAAVERPSGSNNSFFSPLACFGFQVSVSGPCRVGIRFLGSELRL